MQVILPTKEQNIILGASCVSGGTYIHEKDRDKRINQIENALHELNIPYTLQNS